MSMSGVELDDECQKTYQEIQKDKKHRYAIFQIADGKIKLDKVREFRARCNYSMTAGLSFTNPFL